MRRWSEGTKRIPATSFPRDAGGSRTHFYRVAAGRLAVWLQRRSSAEFGFRSAERSCLSPLRIPNSTFQISESVPARNRTWSTTFAESRARPSHSEDNQCLSTPPRNRTSSNSFEDCRASITLAGHTSIPTWNRTRTWTLGESRAIRYTIGMSGPTAGFAPA